MNADMTVPDESNWMESSGLVQILRTFKFAIHPTKLILATVAIFLTMCLGFVLDRIWVGTGHGIAPAELSLYLQHSQTDEPVQGSVGVFDVFRRFELGCARDAIESVRYGRLIGAVDAGAPVTVPIDPTGDHPIRGTFSNILMMGRGVVWLVTQHYWFAILFLSMAILIWAQFGGAICRLAAVQFARDESVTIKEAMTFARANLIGGFFSAPLIPLILCLVIGFVLVLGGIFLRIPWLGDIVAGLVFFLALIAGLCIALLLVGTIGGGSLFWPTIAVEGSDSFDAVSRSFSYVFGRPLRTLWYAGVAIVLGSICWLFARFVLWLTFASVYLFVGAGSGVFWSGPGNKLAALWIAPQFDNLHEVARGVQGAGSVATVLIHLWLVIAVALLWAFLISYYFCGSTAIYYLLRRDVDGTDPSELYTEDEAPGYAAVTPATPATESTPAAADKDTAASTTESAPPETVRKETKKPPTSPAKKKPAKDAEQSAGSAADEDDET